MDDNDRLTYGKLLEELREKSDNSPPGPPSYSTILLGQVNDITRKLIPPGSGILPSNEEVIKGMFPFVMGQLQHVRNKFDNKDIETRYFAFIIRVVKKIDPRLYESYLGKITRPSPSKSGGGSSGGGGGGGGGEDSSYTPPVEICEPLDPAKIKIGFKDIAGQGEVKADILKSYIFPIQFPNLFVTKSKGMLLYGPPGTGKCHAPEEQVVMFDGTLRQVQHIKQGEFIMGDDSTPREVLSTCTGEDDMFEIIPNKGEPYKVNSPHIISLVSLDENFDYKYTDIPLNEYIKKSEEWKKLHTGYRVSIEWPHTTTKISPFEYGKKLFSNKNIPMEYKINSKRNRGELLKGILEKFGTYKNKKYIIENTNKELLDDIMFVARSLGYNSELKKCKDGMKCVIYDFNDFSDNRLVRYSFTIKSLGRGKYCGFELDGNHRYILKDFTVTHNTLMAKAAVHELKGAAAFFTPTPGDIKGGTHGATEKNINYIFKCAEGVIGKKSIGNMVYTSSIIFLDEFDGIGGLKKGDPNMTLSVNALLQKMDGISKDDAKPVSVIAATNYPWNIEGAILRRFSSSVFIDLPDQKAREFLLLDPLHKFFIPPNAFPEGSKPQLMVNGDLNYGFLNTIAVLGGKYHCNRGTKDKPDYTPITKKDIEDIAEKLGASEKGKKIIEKIKIGEINSSDDLEGDEYFGCSGSDIAKIMDIAIQNAAFRAFNSGYFERVSIGRGGGESSSTGHIEESYYYISVPKSYREEVQESTSTLMGLSSKTSSISKKRRYKDITETKILYTLHQEDESEGYKRIPKTDYDKLYNFSICYDDIKLAMIKYPSTINPKDYVDLLIYKYQGSKAPK